MSEEYTTFSDETTTGRKSEAFRNFGRATIGARSSSEDDFEWLLKFQRDFLHKKIELKSEVVLKITDTKKDAKNLIFKNIGNCTVFIVDFSENTRKFIAEIFKLMGKPSPSIEEAVDFLNKSKKFLHLSDQFLRFIRDSEFYSTPIPIVEDILRDITKTVGINSSKKDTIFDRETLRELNQRSFTELVARFSAAFADALDPENQAKLITEELDKQRIISPQHISYLTLGEIANIQRIYDYGNSNAFLLLENAHEQVIEKLEEVSNQYFWKKLKGGSIKQEDSQQLLGIQAADIAAAIAAREYEKFPSDRRAGGKAIKKVFDKVFFNHEWL